MKSLLTLGILLLVLLPGCIMARENVVTKKVTIKPDGTRVEEEKDEAIAVAAARLTGEAKDLDFKRAGGEELKVSGLKESTSVQELLALYNAIRGIPQVALPPAPATQP